MILDLTDIVEEPGKRWTVSVDFPPATTPDLDFQGVAAGEVVIYNTGSTLVFSGSVAATLAASCVRCPKPFRTQVRGDVEAAIPLSAVVGLLAGKPLELEPDLAAVFSARGADLAELVRQALVIALPMRLLCSEECRGLCPHCGKNLNEGPCQCRTVRIDPRLEALANWRKP